MGSGASRSRGPGPAEGRLGRWIIARWYAWRSDPRRDGRLTSPGLRRRTLADSLARRWTASTPPAGDLVARRLGLRCAAPMPVGVLVAGLTGGADPRTVGSGRTGATNALRALGPARAAVVVVGDLLKGAAAGAGRSLRQRRRASIEVVCGDRRR